MKIYNGTPKTITFKYNFMNPRNGGGEWNIEPGKEGKIHEDATMLIRHESDGPGIKGIVILDDYDSLEEAQIASAEKWVEYCERSLIRERTRLIEEESVGLKRSAPSKIEKRLHEQYDEAVAHLEKVRGAQNESSRNKKSSAGKSGDAHVGA